MSLNQIKLPAAVVVDLYKSSLITKSGELTGENYHVNAEIKKETPPKEWKWLGDNRKNILVIVAYPGDIYLAEPELQFLNGILKACHLSINDIAILNRNSYPAASYKELAAFFKSKTILLFGVEPVSLDLPINFPHFQVQAFAAVSFLFSPSLEELQTDEILKSKLWLCLRKIFGI